MEDIWKFILYALAVGLYYFIMGRKKPDEKQSSQTTSAKPFMSPAAKPQARPRPVLNQPDTNEMPASLEDLLRRFQREPDTAPEAPQPALVPKNKVEKSNQILTTADRLDLEEAKKIGRQEVVNYDNEIPTYRNEANEINYENSTYRNEANEINYENPETADYQGLNNRDEKRFGVFEIKEEVKNPFAELLQKPESLRTAFILSEILKRKEF